MKWFEIPEELVPKLIELQNEDVENLNEPVIRDENAVTMFYGMGDPMYLTLDGRVIVEDMLGEKPPREAETLAEAAMAIVVGAQVRKCPKLLSLLPERPESAVDCENCQKSGWWQPAPNFGPFVCGECGGLGWKLKEDQNA